MNTSKTSDKKPSVSNQDSTADNTKKTVPVNKQREKFGDNFYHSEKTDTIYHRTDDGVWHANGILDPANRSTEHPATLEVEQNE